MILADEEARDRATKDLFDFEGWSHREPADPAAVVALESTSGIKWPDEYSSLLRLCDGGCGPLGVEPGWFQIWRAGEVLALDHNYQVQAYLPDLFGFGSNGGGELFAFDTRRGPPWRVVMVPFVGMEEENVVEIAGDFVEFLHATGRVASD